MKGDLPHEDWPGAALMVFGVDEARIFFRSFVLSFLSVGVCGVFL
jgi:hypothetical protein